MIYWIIFIIVSVTCEGFLYNIMNPDKKNPINEHVFFTLLRFLVFVIIFYKEDLNIINNGDVNLLDNEPLNRLLFNLFKCALVFPFIHDTLYYLIRHLLDNAVYKDWYWTTSTTSTAISDRFLNATVRLLMFVAGLCYINTSVSWIIVTGLLLTGFGIGIRNTIKLRK